MLEGGAIDSDYRENVKVILPNFSKKKSFQNLLKCLILTILLQEGKIKDLDQLEFKWLLTTKYLNIYPVIKSDTKEMV